MQTRTVQRGTFITSALVGVALIFIGARFMLAPETAERGYGLRFDEGGNYAFHTIKGIRDIFTGVLILALVALRQRQALGIVMASGAMIPLVDMVIVLTTPNSIKSAAWIHGGTMVVVLGLAALLLGTTGRARSQLVAGQGAQ